MVPHPVEAPLTRDEETRRILREEEVVRDRAAVLLQHGWQLAVAILESGFVDSAAAP